MLLTTTPPILISPVTDTVQSWRLVEGETPVDFTASVDNKAWSAEFLLENCGFVAFRAAAELDAAGYINITIPAATSAAIRSAKRIDAKYQIRFTAPLSDFDEVWQGPIVVQEVLA